MIPEIFLEGVVTPLNFTKDPLLSKNDVLSKFLNKKGNQILHFTEDILKPEIKKILNERGLKIEKVDVWRWDINFEFPAPAHTDGDYRNNMGRKVGLNWGLDSDTGVEFFDTINGTINFESEIDGRTHTLWSYPSGTLPLITWKNKFPSLINTQVPHHITGPKNSFRYSITIKFLGNPSYDDVLTKLWDVRLDKDFWQVDLAVADFDFLKMFILNFEKENNITNTNLSAYNLPRDSELLKVLKKYCKKEIKAMRVFTYQAGANAKKHIDYDHVLKVSPAYGLNIPLYGSNNCYIDFYKNLGDVVEKWADGTGSFLWPSDESLVYYSSTVQINQPYLIRINIPHAVRIEDSCERKVLSVRFNDSKLDNPSDIVSNLVL
jgi:hypothetical protein